WIARTPDSPWISFDQFLSTPTPRGVTRPRPGTTTRRMGLGSALLGLDELDGVLDGEDLLRGVVRDLDAELLLEGHDQLDRVQAVGAKVVDETGVGRDLRLFDAQVFDHDLLHAVFDVAHLFVSFGKTLHRADLWPGGRVLTQVPGAGPD